MTTRVTKAPRRGCAWGEILSDPRKVRIAGLIDDVHAFVGWELKRSDGDDDDETELQREEFREDAAEGTRAKGRGFGDEAYWSPPDDNNPTAQCHLYVRDSNLVVDVALGGDEHPVSTCKSEAEKIARAAITDMPR
ncbi:hypothetical protein LRS74_00555 [Streptomyces sp. LX-29]|uniref:hypothetical protein n=1 Tax=Streptomyces sp. LX-29 TaxID=2900152 RepID=UPI00240CF3B0|nr:hypothetical protein [Streptomyces sp. LX-29]WFB05670.1 hypothetical protein LRS74_00555 [Streptomyces sp. LX-29]